MHKQAVRHQVNTELYVLRQLMQHITYENFIADNRKILVHLRNIPGRASIALYEHLSHQTDQLDHEDLHHDVVTYYRLQVKVTIKMFIDEARDTWLSDDIIIADQTYNTVFGIPHL